MTAALHVFLQSRGRLMLHRRELDAKAESARLVTLPGSHVRRWRGPFPRGECPACGQFVCLSRDRAFATSHVCRRADGGSELASVSMENGKRIVHEADWHLRSW